jgi:antirestriction protein ArdC
MRPTNTRSGHGKRSPESAVRSGTSASGARGGAAHAPSSRPHESADHTAEDLYGAVTRRIIADLEGGRIPWVQPWGKAGGAGAGLPRNALTRRPYSGINILILWGAVIEHGYATQGWMTFAQALQAGAAVRRGERGTTIVYADRFTPERERQRARETGDDAKAIAFLKRFTVFNVAQIDGLPEGLAADPAPLAPRAIVPVAEAVIAASGVPFRIGGDRAFYAPGADIVQVPPQSAFFEPINYYRTCLHELTHATGHTSRVGRNLTSAFGTKDYAREELVAEMGSAFLCAALGIVPTVRHADYLASWLEVLRDDLSEDAAVRASGAPRGRAIFRAASAASKAADWLLARHHAAQAAQGGGAA